MDSLCHCCAKLALYACRRWTKPSLVLPQPLTVCFKCKIRGKILKFVSTLFLDGLLLNASVAVALDFVVLCCCMVQCVTMTNAKYNKIKYVLKMCYFKNVFLHYSYFSFFFTFHLSHSLAHCLLFFSIFRTNTADWMWFSLEKLVHIHMLMFIIFVHTRASSFRRRKLTAIVYLKCYLSAAENAM